METMTDAIDGIIETTIADAANQTASASCQCSGKRLAYTAKAQIIAKTKCRRNQQTNSAWQALNFS